MQIAAYTERLFFLLAFFTLVACGGSGGGGSEAGGTVGEDDDDYDGGGVSELRVESLSVYQVNDLETPLNSISIDMGVSEFLGNQDIQGLIDFPPDLDALYLVAAGTSEPEVSVNGLFSGSQLIEDGGRLTATSDLAYRNVAMLLATTSDVGKLRAALDRAAAFLLKADITGDGIISHEDISAWRASSHADALWDPAVLDYEDHLVDGEELWPVAAALTDTVVSSLESVFMPHLSKQGDLLFGVGSNNLMVVDVSNISNPVRIASLELPDYMHCIESVPGYVFLGSNNGLFVVDVTDPEDPVLVYEADTIAIRRIVASNDLLFLSMNGADQIYDIKQPSSPGVVGPVGSRQATDMKVVGDKLYVATLFGFAIFTIQEGGTVLLDHWEELSSTDYYSTRLDVRGNRLYVLNEYSGLTVWDVSDTLSPVKLSQTIGFYASDMFVRDTRVFASTDNGVATFDITDDSAPALIGFSGNPFGSTGGLKVVGDMLAMGGGALNIMPLDVTTKAPSVIGGYVGVSQSPLPVVAGDQMYAVAESKFTIFDFSDPGQLSILGQADTSLNTRQLAYEYPYVYAVSDEKVLEIFDVSNPESPESVHVVEVGDDGGMATLAVKDGVVFASSPRKQSIEMFDARDVSDVKKVTDALDSLEFASSVTVYNDLLIIKENGTKIYDISDPLDPRHLSSIDGAFKTVRDDYLYIYTGRPGDAFARVIEIHDISDPRHPVSLGFTQLPPSSDPGDAAVIGDFLYVMQDGLGVMVVDVSDKANPQFVMQTNELRPRGLTQGADLLLVNSLSGLTVVQGASRSLP